MDDGRKTLRNMEVTNMIRTIKCELAAFAAPRNTTDPEGFRCAVKGGGTG